jgi:hypothetical protein
MNSELPADDDASTQTLTMAEIPRLFSVPAQDYNFPMQTWMRLGIFALPLLVMGDDTEACVQLRRKVDAFTWQNNPFRNPGDLLTAQKAFGQWPRALGPGRMAIVEDGCYAELQVTGAGQIAAATYHAGHCGASGEKTDPRPEMVRALERLKESVARMQNEIAWLEAQLAEEVPVAPLAAPRRATGVKVQGDVAPRKQQH